MPINKKDIIFEFYLNENRKGKKSSIEEYTFIVIFF